ncbi:hypothetical protein D9M68_704090 [compost metagenome]
MYMAIIRSKMNAMIVTAAASANGSRAWPAAPLSMRRLRPEASARMSSTPWPISVAKPVRNRCTSSAMRSRSPGSAGCAGGAAAPAVRDEAGFVPDACPRNSSTSALRASGFSSRSASAAGVSPEAGAAVSCGSNGIAASALACQPSDTQHSITASSRAASHGLSRRRRQKLAACVRGRKEIDAVVADLTTKESPIRSRPRERRAAAVARPPQVR